VSFNLAALVWLTDNQTVDSPVLLSRGDYASLLRQCRRDPLTGLLNRIALYDVLDRELAASARYGHPLALMFLDLDSFKAYNDRCGHVAGDTLLRKLGTVLESAVRRCDAAARCGGDEFVVVVRKVLRDDATRLAQRLVRTIAAHWRNEGVTVSIGVSVAPINATVVEELIATADEAMYRAKSMGGNTFALAFDEQDLGRLAPA
jgi:diguanylate cyclase (GGDEF)-like protein